MKHELQRRNDGTIKAQTGLTEKQDLFVGFLISGKKQTESARLAGYSDPGSDGTRLLKLPKIARAVKDSVIGKIETEGVLIAYEVLKEVITNPETPASVKVQGAKIMLDKAGLDGNPNGINGLNGKAFAEMSLEELQTLVNASPATPDSRPAIIDVTPSKPDRQP